MFGKIAPHLIKAAPYLIAVAALASLTAQVVGMYNGWNNADKIIEKPKEALTTSDKLEAGAAQGLSYLTFGAFSAKEVYDWQHGSLTTALTGTKDPADLAKEYEEQYSKYFKEKYLLLEQEKEKTLQQNLQSSGMDMRLNDIVNQANSRGIESLSAFQRQLYNSLERDEFGNLKRTHAGQYKFNKEKESGLISELADGSNLTSMNLTEDDYKALESWKEYLDNLDTSPNTIATELLSGNDKSGSYNYVTDPTNPTNPSSQHGVLSLDRIQSLAQIQHDQSNLNLHYNTDSLSNMIGESIYKTTGFPTDATTPYTFKKLMDIIVDDPRKFESSDGNITHDILTPFNASDIFIKKVRAAISSKDITQIDEVLNDLTMEFAFLTKKDRETGIELFIKKMGTFVKGYWV